MSYIYIYIYIYINNNNNNSLSIIIIIIMFYRLYIFVSDLFRGISKHIASVVALTDSVSYFTKRFVRLIQTGSF